MNQCFLSTSGSAHRAGRFRGSYECCLRQRPLSESEHNPSTHPPFYTTCLCQQATTYGGAVPLRAQRARSF